MEQERPTTPTTPPAEAKDEPGAAEAKQADDGQTKQREDGTLPSFIPRTGLVFSEKKSFAPVLCRPKLMPIRPYHVQRREQEAAADDDDDDAVADWKRAPVAGGAAPVAGGAAPADGAAAKEDAGEQKAEATVDGSDTRYLAERAVTGEWGRTPVVDAGYDPSASAPPRDEGAA